MIYMHGHTYILKIILTRDSWKGASLCHTLSDDGYSLFLCMCQDFGALPAIEGMVTLKIRYIIAIGGPTILQGNAWACIHTEMHFSM